MKKINRLSLVLFILLITQEGFSQFVGIGNTSPNFLLDLSGRMRIRGGADNNNSAGLWLSGTGSDSAID